jgi:hypothetical protein
VKDAIGGLDAFGVGDGVGLLVGGTVERDDLAGVSAGGETVEVDGDWLREAGCVDELEVERVGFGGFGNGVEEAITGTSDGALRLTVAKVFSEEALGVEAGNRSR